MKEFVFAVVVMSSVAQAAAQNNTGIIEGRVLHPGSSEGISDVQVTLVAPGTPANPDTVTPNGQTVAERVATLIASMPQGIAPDIVANQVANLRAQLGTPGSQFTAVTDNSGSFSFVGLVPGRYTIRGQREGYFGWAPNGAPLTPNTITSTVDVSIQQRTPPVILPMVRGAIISGRVRGPNGQILTGATVTAYRVDYRGGQQILAPANTKTTDDQGEFRLFWLPPGDYYVAASPRRTSSPPGPQDSWTRTFFPGVVEASRATPLVVLGGAQLGGIDINLRAATNPVKVSGTVVNGVSSDTGLPWFVYLVSRAPSALIDNDAANFPNSSTDRTGRFEIRGVQPGSYDLIAVVPNAQGRPYPGRSQIEVGNGDLSGVTVTVAPGVDVRARIVFEGATPANRPLVRVNLRSKERWPTPFDSAVASVAPAGRVGTGPITNQPFLADDGSFLFPGVPQGRYTIEVRLPPNGYVADVRMLGSSVYDSGFAVDRATPAPIEVVINTAGALVYGTVHDSRQQLVTAGRVVLVPQQSRRENPALYRLSDVDANGHFTMSAVAPGDYKLFAWDEVSSTAYMNAGFLEKYEERGQTVRVGTGSTIEQQLTLISIGFER